MAGAAATGIEVLRSTNGVNFAKITTVSASATSYSDPGPLATGKTYTYELIAVNQAGSSAAVRQGDGRPHDAAPRTDNNQRDRIGDQPFMDSRREQPVCLSSSRPTG